MFLRRFREKSNQKYINKILNSRKASVHERRIESVGVILNLDEFSDYDQIRMLLKTIGVKDNKVKFMALISDEKSAPNTWDSYFNPKDFGWNGKVNNIELVEFINTPFDALISYYKQDNLELNMVTTLSKANFKIGISGRDQRLNDFIINIEPKKVDLFNAELIKYLRVLNKI